MKHYCSPVIEYIAGTAQDVITSSANKFVDTTSLNDTDVTWGGTW